MSVTCSAGVECTIQNHECLCPSNGASGPSLGGNGTAPSTVFAFTWSQVGADGILLTGSGAAPQEVPFTNLTQISGGVSDANFSAVANGGATVPFTLASGPACVSR
jgi:hypothetical protein